MSVSVRPVVFAVLAGLALMGSYEVLILTRSGAGLWTDSFYYISAARNLLSGHG